MKQNCLRYSDCTNSPGCRSRTGRCRKGYIWHASDRNHRNLATNIKKTVALLTILLLSTTLSGCLDGECTQYKKFTGDTPERRQLIAWADEKIFSAHLSATDRRVGDLNGPGRWSIRPISGEPLMLPSALRSMRYWVDGPPPEIRILEESSKNDVVGIFLGRRSFQGLVVSKASIRELMPEISSRPNRDLIATGNRVAILCYSD